LSFGRARIKMRRMKSLSPVGGAFFALVWAAACGSSSSSSSSKDAAAPGSDGGETEASVNDGSSGSDANHPADGNAGNDGQAMQDAGTTGDGSIPKGAPITATNDQWTWVDFPDTSCGNGSPTGLGVNLSSTSTNVLVYLEGGGGCWNAETCYTLMTASYFTTGYAQSDFQTESTDTTYLALPGGFFDRTATANPFKDYSYVYLPYCTGDIFAGNNVTTLGSNTASFVGYKNVTAYLSRIVPTFPSATKVVLAGSSAGGFGALWNWYQTQQAFGSVRVDLLDDSGTFMPPDIVPTTSGNEQAEMSAWNLTSTAPPCTACGMDPSALYGYYAKLYPTHRGALLSYTMDSVLPQYMGISTAQFTMGLGEDITNQFAPNANLGAFLVGASGHVLLFTPTLTTNGVTLQTWVTQMVTDDAAWMTQMP
jgi:hypothetical protein